MTSLILLDIKGIRTIRHPPYDLAPADLFLFPRTKEEQPVTHITGNCGTGLQNHPQEVLRGFKIQVAKQCEDKGG